MQSEQSAKRSKRWTNAETKAFLKFYGARRDEFMHPRKKRLAFSNVVEDLVAAGFNSGFTPRHLEVKMQTLLRAYKEAKENKSKTSPCNPPFMEEMEKLFGKKPIHVKSESMNFGSECLFRDVDEPDSLPTSPDAPSKAKSLTFPEVPVEVSLAVAASGTSDAEADGDASVVSDASSSRPIRIKKEKRNLSRSEYYKAKINQRERELVAIERRFQQRQQQKAQQYAEKAESRRKKLKLLEKILNKI